MIANSVGYSTIPRWPVLEAGCRFFRGSDDGKDMTLAWPGRLYALKIHVEQPGSRLGICAGAGEQIATSAFHSYNHEIAITTRLLF